MSAFSCLGHKRVKEALAPTETAPSPSAHAPTRRVHPNVVFCCRMPRETGLAQRSEQRTHNPFWHSWWKLPRQPFWQARSHLVAKRRYFYSVSPCARIRPRQFSSEPFGMTERLGIWLGCSRSLVHKALANGASSRVEISAG